MGVFNMDILGRNITDIQRRMVDQTNYRINVVKGVVESANINGTFNCYIAGETVIYPKIPTFSRNPKLQPGDEVTIEFINGCRETPAILAPEDIRERPDTTELSGIIRRYGLIIAGPNALKVFNMQGVALYTLTTGGWAYSACDITMDANGNSYTETNWNTLKKYDSSGNLLATHEIEDMSNWFESINIGPDGYLYTFEGIASGYDIKKRNITDLTILETISITVDPFAGYYGGICLDSDGNFYIYNDDEDKLEKWSNAGVLLAQLSIGNLSNEYAGFGVCGSNVYFVKSTNKIYYAPLSLASYSEWNLPSSEAYALTVADGKLILSGWDGDGDGATTQYDSDRNLVLQVKLAPVTSYAYKAGGYNF